MNRMAQRAGRPTVITNAVLETWVDAYATRLFHAAAGLSSEAEAPDLCQEVFLVAARKRAGFDGRSAPYTWLNGILRNLVRDKHKKRTRRGLRLLSAEPTPVPDPERTLSSQQDRQRLRAAVAELPERQREVVQLYYLQEHTVSDVAEALSLAAGTVKSRLFEARRTLRHALQGDL
jgi:RNA polymerase sigma-70 factor (ECF subfamily)